MSWQEHVKDKIEVINGVLDGLKQLTFSPSEIKTSEKTKEILIEKRRTLLRELA